MDLREHGELSQWYQNNSVWGQMVAILVVNIA